MSDSIPTPTVTVPVPRSEGVAGGNEPTPEGQTLSVAATPPPQPPPTVAVPSPEDAPFFQKYAPQILATGLTVNLRARGADIQVLAKSDPFTQPLRVYFRNKHDMKQWYMTEDQARAMYAALPTKLTLDELVAAIEAVPGVVHLQGPLAPPTIGFKYAPPPGTVTKETIL